MGHTIITGDSREILKSAPENSFAAVVTDPPYGLSKVREKDVRACLAAWLASDTYEHGGKGFMGQKWDSFVPGPDLWREVLRVLKPGGHALVFAGSRMSDFMALSLRLAGFEVRDTIMWMYGSGFPKSMSVSKSIDAKILTGRSNSTALSVSEKTRPKVGSVRRVVSKDRVAENIGKSGGRANMERWHNHKQADIPVTTARTAEAGQWEGWGTTLKPAYEPIIVARKPLAGTVATNVLEHGTGALNIDGCRIACEVERPPLEHTGRTGNVYGSGLEGSRAAGTTTQGRWPANVILDEDAAAALDKQSGVLKGRGNKGPSKGGGGMFGHGETINNFEPGGSGGASRFFYCAKASKAEKTCKGTVQCNHPTVKPLALMRYLCRLVTPPGGIILDPFAGSGSTLCAAKQEGFDAVGIELGEEYSETARQRVAATEPDIPTT